MMKFVVKINDRKMLLTAEQVESLADMLCECEYYVEEYVGRGKGSMGTNSEYHPHIKLCNIDDWFDAKVMRGDYIETIKLRMKLDAAAKERGDAV